MSDPTTKTTASQNGRPAGDWQETILNEPTEEEAAAMREELAEPHPDEREPVWKWSGLDELLAPIEPVEAIVKGMIAERSITLLFGEDGSLKSMLAMDLAVCVADGKPWLKGLPDLYQGEYLTKKTTVLWYDADNGDHLVRERLRALIMGHQVRPATLHYISFPDPIFDASDDLSIAYIIDDIKARGAGLVIFDNLSTISGDIDENSPEIQKVMTNLKRIIQETGVAIILIHHSTKATGRDRGHSRIRQNCDLALKVKRVTPNSETIKIVPSKIRRIPVKPFAGLFTYENQGELLEKARFFGVEYIPDNEDEETEAKPTKREQAKDDILELLKTRGQLNQSEIVDEITNAGRKTILQALDELVKENAVITQQGPRHSVIYQLRLPNS